MPYSNPPDADVRVRLRRLKIVAVLYLAALIYLIVAALIA